jgi:hypothetical protein
MTEEQINKIIGMNQQVLMLLGIATALLKTPDCEQPDDEYWIKYNWFIKAIENVVYLDKPIPPMPRG